MFRPDFDLENPIPSSLDDAERRGVGTLTAWAFAAAVAASAAAHDADARTGTYSLDFQQRFATEPCPADAPEGFFCLRVTGTAKSRTLGAVSFERRVLFDIRRFDEKHPTCVPDETKGVATLPGGTLTFRAPGSVCLADGTAAYDLIVTGGTGAYARAAGGGRITVPPPAGESSGRELWSIELF